MKVVCSDLLLPHLTGKLPITSPPNLWQVTLCHDTLHPGRCRRVCVQVAEEKAVREVNKHTGAVIENSESLRSLQMPELKQRQSPRSIMHARH